MTIILAIRDKEGHLWMAGDSMASGGGESFNIREPKVFSRGEFTYGYAGSFRLGQLVRHHFVEPKKPARMSDQQYIMKVWSVALQAILFEQGFLQEEDNVYGMDGSLMILYRGRIYLLQEDMSIIEPLDPFLAVGAGATFAQGALAALYDLLGPQEALQKAMDVTCQFSPACGGPVTILRHMSK